ncbi:MAG: type I glyceraldehyde-3-phosphate dehydrogenase [Phycisphaeraceae bacterium]|nr:type I glyceraldehyde-3-phosphate dehydrogenase [Phycisphaeraceae bacterium]
MAIKIAINGFGRIGRLVYRIAMEQGGFEVVGVNDLVPSDNLAYLLRYDTCHGRFSHAVETRDDGFACRGIVTRCLSEKDPSKLPWGSLGAAYVLESTGLFTEAEKARLHIDAGARRVLISAPTKSEKEVPTIVYKVNHLTYDPSKHTVVSNASCTTNCLAPVAKVILQNFGIEEGLMTTVHAVTATQPTQDGPSKKDWRGGRNAYQNIIPSSTGAAKAAALCIPELKGKLTGMSFRVPTANVSAVDLTFRTSRPTSLAEINVAMKSAAEGEMSGVLGYTDDEVVSCDFMSDPRSSIFDAKAGIQLNDRFFKVVSWYDNEYGYAARCVDMLRLMAERDGVK